MDFPGTGDIMENINGGGRDRTETVRICGTKASTLFLVFSTEKIHCHYHCLVLGVLA